MVTYKGLPAPKISDFLSRTDSRARYAPGTEFVMFTLWESLDAVEGVRR